MDPREIETLIQRLIDNPHDEDALAQAHRAGTLDPKGYAVLLERVGQGTADPAYAAHWLSEAANVWSTTIGDAHHAARTLMAAIEKDPTQRTAADRLAHLYRDKGDVRGLVALLERLVKVLTPLCGERLDVRLHLIALHEELGRLWGDQPLARAERALENWKRLVKIEPRHAYAVYAARELLKAQQQYLEAVPYFAMEQALVSDPARKLALYRDEAEVRRRAGDLPGATQALRTAHAMQPDDATLTQEFGVAILDRLSSGEQVSREELAEATHLFVTLAETYDGEYGLLYALSALKASPSHDRAMQLAEYYAGLLGRSEELGPSFVAYLAANPTGYMADAGRAFVAARLHLGSAVRPDVALPPEPGPAAATPPSTAHKAMGAEPLQSPKPETEEIDASGVDVVEAASDPAPQPIDPRPVAEVVSSAEPTGLKPAPVGAEAGPPVVEPPHRPTAHSQVAVDDLEALLVRARAEVEKGDKAQALIDYRNALKLEPANPEALSWVEEYLRQKRSYADLRDVLFAAARAPHVSPETRTAQLRDVAGLCESQLQDLATAVLAWKQICQIDRADAHAHEHLRQLLEKTSRWDDLAIILEQEAMAALEPEQKLAVEKKLANLHETKRQDLVSAGEAWVRIGALTPQDDAVILTAVKLFEQGGRVDLAVQALRNLAPAIVADGTRAALLEKLGDLQVRTGDHVAAAEAYATAAHAVSEARLWDLAFDEYKAAGRVADAVTAIDRRVEVAPGAVSALPLGKAALLLEEAGEPEQAFARLTRAIDLDPDNDVIMAAFDALCRRTGKERELVSQMRFRAGRLVDKAKRVAALRAAAELQTALGDGAGRRETLETLLGEGEDGDVLTQLVQAALAERDNQGALGFLGRLYTITEGVKAKVVVALQEAALLSNELADLPAAIARYEVVLRDLDPTNETALAAIAELHSRRGDSEGLSVSLERALAVSSGEVSVSIAQRLAVLYEGPLRDPLAAIRVLDIVHRADPEDFDAISRLEVLCEEVGDHERVVSLLKTLIEVEGDEEEAARLTLRIADVLANRLGRGQEALLALEKPADEGAESCREAFVVLGDKLGLTETVARKLVAWNESASGPARGEALRSAFKRFLSIERYEDAARVGVEIARGRGVDRDLASMLEGIGIRARDLELVAVAHDVLVRDLSGMARAIEFVRQAEALAHAGMDPLEAVQHGEIGFGGAPPSEVEPLLLRLAALVPAPGHVVDLYERQVGRCRAVADRLAALGRAAQVAAERGANDRARSFFELALGGAVQEETVAELEAAANLSDERSGGTALRTTLAEALATGGQASRDGGRTRAAFLRRAATIAHRDLKDVDRAFGWLGDALVTHVDDASLDALEALGQLVGDSRQVEATLSRALEEVFDGPLVRKLLQRRSRLRRHVLGDLAGAAADLKKLHDLAHSDQEVMAELTALLMELGDHRGMVQLYEDQILRGRDPGARAELARTVARIWEEDIGDAREAADAWRRVLRMKAGDPEATEGLDRAKAGKLRRGGSRTQPPPRILSPSVPPAPKTPQPQPHVLRPLTAPKPPSSSVVAAPPPIPNDPAPEADKSAVVLAPVEAVFDAPTLHDELPVGSELLGSSEAPPGQSPLRITDPPTEPLDGPDAVMHMMGGDLAPIGAAGNQVFDTIEPPTQVPPRANGPEAVQEPLAPVAVTAEAEDVPVVDEEVMDDDVAMVDDDELVIEDEGTSPNP